MADEGIEIPFSTNALMEQAIKNGDLKGTPIAEPTQAEKEAAAKAEADKKAAEAAKVAADAKAKEGQKEEPKLSDEEIQAKLDQLAEKEEKTLTEDEKKFIEKYTQDEADEVTAVKQTFEQKFGIKIEGDFDNSPEGLIKLSDEVTKVRAQSLLLNYFESVPYMKDFYQHAIVEKRGIETFLQKNTQPAHKSIKLEQVTDTQDDNTKAKIVANQKTLVKMDLLAKGNKEDDVNALLELYEDKGSLYDKAKEAYTSLDTKHQQAIDAKLKAEEARIQQEEKEIEAEYRAMEAILDKNDFGGVSIPTADVKAFKSAMLQPLDDQGRTLLDYKRSKLTLAQRALIDYIIFKDMKVDGLTPAVQTSSKKFTFKKANEDNNKRQGGRTRGAGTEEQQHKNPNVNLFDIKNIDFTKLKEVQQ